MEEIKAKFEESNSQRAWFVSGGYVDADTPEGFVYGDFTTDMCWTCFFDAYSTQQLRADKAEADLKAMGERYQKDLLLSRERWCYGNRADAKLAAAEQKISELVAAFMPLIKHWDDLATGESANVDRARKALNSNPEAESHE